MYLQRESNPHFLSPPHSPPPQSHQPLSLPPGYNAPPPSYRRSPPRIKPKRRQHDQVLPPLDRPIRTELNQYPDEPDFISLPQSQQPPNVSLPPGYNAPPARPRLPPPLRVKPKRRQHDQMSPPERSSPLPLNQYYPDEDGHQSLQNQLNPESEEPQRFDDRNQPPHHHPQASRPWPSRLHEDRRRHRTHTDQHTQPPPRGSDLRVPTSRKTKPIAWLIAACCFLFWIIIILGGLIVLIVYLIYRPRLPKFDIADASLNAAYLDMDYLLNSDLTLLANFTNPNKKMDVDFNVAILNLYHEDNFIATRYVEPFTAIKRQSEFETIHMISSQVPLSIPHSQDLRKQMDNGRVIFDIKGFFHARSKLGFLSYSYWLYTHCTITLTGPPSGILIGKKCTTKR